MTSFHPEPLAPELVDELLSADIDGEFDNAARDLGMEPDIARARLDATPGTAARAGALAGARDALGEAPSLDEVTRARLVRQALEAQPRSHRVRTVLVGATGVAAVAALIVGLVALVSMGSNSSSSNSSSANNASASTTAAARVPPRASALHNSTDLRDYVGALLARPTGQAASGTGSTTFSAAEANRAAKDAANGSPSSSQRDCTGELAKSLGVTSAPIARAPVVYQSKPGELVVFRNGARTIAVVYAANDCTPLVEQLSH